MPDNVSVQTSGSFARSTFLLPWTVALIEGFSTLAVEVIAIRLAIPIVGSSITLTGVMLGVVLLALSAGYWRGGALSARWDKARTRTALTRNLLIAAVVYGAVAFPLEAATIEKALDLGLSLPMAIGAAASLLLLLPIYLASQTVPMLAELTNVEGKAGKASGQVLFFSTVGSVAGGVVTPVWLFPWLGVAHSTFVVCGLLAGGAAVMAIGQPRALRALGFGGAALVAVIGVNAMASRGQQGFSFDSAYQSIRIVDEESDSGRAERTLIMSGSRSSGVYADTGDTSFAYVRAADKVLAESGAETVLVIGSAGFTFPRDAAALSRVRRVDAVDVDPVVKGIAEREFLRQPLPAKVRFLPLSARYAVRRLNRDGRRYGFTFIDAYFGRGIPDELVTVEFFRDARAVSDRVAVNAVLDRDMESAFARNVLASFREAFGAVWVTDVKPGDSEITNIMVTSWPASGAARWNGRGTAYRDDRNAADRDHLAMVWSGRG
jgi:spermidine synthase